MSQPYIAFVINNLPYLLYLMRKKEIKLSSKTSLKLICLIEIQTSISFSFLVGVIKSKLYVICLTIYKLEDTSSIEIIFTTTTYIFLILKY